MRHGNIAWLWSITAALAGFLFGFDTAVISGAEQAIQRLWQMDDALHGLAVSSALWGTVIGAITGSIPSDRYGRRPTLVTIGVLYTVSAIGRAQMAAPWATAALTTRLTRSRVMNGRTPSCTTTMSGSRARSACSARQTDS